MAKKSTKRSKNSHEQAKPVEPTTPVEMATIPETVERVNTPSGLTSVTDYYQEPDPEPTITAQERAAIRDEALTATFGVPVPDFRSAVVARLNSKLRS